MGAIGMAVQAHSNDRSPRAPLNPEARRRVPDLLLGEPADWRLKQKAIPIGQTGKAARPRSEEVIDGHVKLVNGFAGLAAAHLPVQEAVALPLDQKLRAQRFERVMSLR